MSTQILPALVSEQEGAASLTESAPISAGAWLASLVLFGLLAVQLPALVRTPLDSDATHYDLCARICLDGGVLYRDALDTNLPGMPWIHMTLRSLAGWSSEVLQIVDLLVALVIVCLLVRLLPATTDAALAWITGLVLVSCYLSVTEWCRVQRDVWMLLPALLAVHCRRRQLASPSRLWHFLEGLCWAAAFWIKPFVAIPALACWVASARLVFRGSNPSPQLPPQRGEGEKDTLAPLSPCGRGAGGEGTRRVAVDGLLVLTGGLVLGALGTLWLIYTGAWPAFWQLMTDWNRQYATHDFFEKNRALLLLGMLLRFFPWILVHLIAVPLAIHGLRAREAGELGRKRLLLSAVYLGWLFQSVFLQHPFDYVHLPAILLGLAIVANRLTSLGPGPLRALGFAALILGVCLRMPDVTRQRAEVWAECFHPNSVPSLRDRVSRLERVSWIDLAEVERFLRDQEVRDGEVLCWEHRARPLHQHLGVRPPTRYLMAHLNIRVYQRQREQIWGEFAASPVRFVVCDVLTADWKMITDPERKRWSRSRADLDKGLYPTDKLVFRAGRYAVYAVDGPSLEAWIDRHLDL